MLAVLPESVCIKNAKNDHELQEKNCLISKCFWHALFSATFTLKLFDSKIMGEEKTSK